LRRTKLPIKGGSAPEEGGGGGGEEEEEQQQEQEQEVGKMWQKQTDHRRQYNKAHALRITLA